MYFQLIIKEQWASRQISGGLKLERISVSHQCIYNLIHADVSGELARHIRHNLKYRHRPKRKPFPDVNRTGIHSRPEQAEGKGFLGDGFDSGWLQPRHTHNRGIFHQPALHDQTYSWEDNRAVGQGSQAFAVAQQEEHQQ